MNEGTKITGAAALDRAFALLAAILGDDGARSIAELAAGLDLPMSTAHRFVAAMVRRGLIVRVGRGRYAPSFTLARSGGAARAEAVLTRVARPHIRVLARQTRTAVHLGILDGDMVTYLVKEAVGTPLFTQEGMQLEAYCSGVGKILLAHAAPEILDAYLDGGPFVPLTDATIVDPAAIRRHLDDVRLRDFATDDREVDEQLGCIAVPVRAADGRVVAALSSSASPPRPASADAVAALHDCARRIGVSLA